MGNVTVTKLSALNGDFLLQQGQSILRFKRPLWLLLFVSLFFLSACATGTTGTWPGLSAAGNRVYVAYNDRVTAVDVDARNELWSYNGENGGVQFFAPPSIEDGRLVIGDFGTSGGFFSTGLTVSVYALEEAGSGTNTLWVSNSAISGRVFAEPLQVDDYVIVGTSDNQVVALDIDSGEMIWEFATGNSIWSQPAYNDGKIYVTSVDRRVYALDLETGDILWEAQLTGANGGSPVVGDQFIYVGSFDGKLHAYDFDGNEAWTATADDWIWGAPTYTEASVYYTDLAGNVYAISSTEGTTQWEQSVEGSIQSSPVVHDDTVYIVSGDSGQEEISQGHVTALSASDGSIIWTQTVDAPVNATPVVVGDTLVVVIIEPEAQLPEIVQLDLEDGNVIWSEILNQE